MHAETLLILASQSSIGLVTVLLVGPLIGFLGSVALACARREGEPPPSLAARFQFVREFAWLAVPFVVIASFGMTIAPREFRSGLGLPMKAVTAPAPPPPPRAVGVDAGQRVPASTVSTNDTSARPAWVDKVRVVEGDCEQIVLTSRQYSTREEAEQELRFAAAQLVEEDLRRLQTGRFRPLSWRPDMDQVVTHAVKKRYDDVTEHDFGSFSHPMHSVSWQVELSPAVRTEFLPAWRRELISFRVLLVACLASLFAMAASASVMYFRLDALTHGRSRGALKLLTGGLTAGWLMFVATSFSQDHLW